MIRQNLIKVEQAFSIYFDFPNSQFKFIFSFIKSLWLKQWQQFLYFDFSATILIYVREWFFEVTIFYSERFLIGNIVFLSLCEHYTSNS